MRRIHVDAFYICFSFLSKRLLSKRRFDASGKCFRLPYFFRRKNVIWGLESCFWALRKFCVFMFFLDFSRPKTSIKDQSRFSISIVGWTCLLSWPRGASDTVTEVHFYLHLFKYKTQSGVVCYSLLQFFLSNLISFTIIKPLFWSFSTSMNIFPSFCTQTVPWPTRCAGKACS